MVSLIRCLRPVGFVLAWAILLTACQSINKYDREAHQDAVILKIETLALMAKSGEPFAVHASEVEALNGKIDAAHEMARSTPNNDLVAREWAIMRDPDRDLYGGFVKRWQTSGKISPPFREEMVAQVSEGFDFIICLEAAKQSGERCATGGG
jgi:hypothetical protein